MLVTAKGAITVTGPLEVCGTRRGSHVRYSDEGRLNWGNTYLAFKFTICFAGVSVFEANFSGSP